MGRSVEVEFLPTYRRVLSMSADGHSLNAITRMLSDEHVPTAKGGKWDPSTVRAIVISGTAKTL
ncbi:recombinase family protein [Microbacterium sp. NPDC079176]|uniref:recombinase family protein n=1 Tax=Microbacterium sp. NPDC079176 TaxID=3154768 RepID=UPI003418DB1B